MVVPKVLQCLKAVSQELEQPADQLSLWRHCVSMRVSMALEQEVTGQKAPQAMAGDLTSPTVYGAQIMA